MALFPRIPVACSAAVSSGLNRASSCPVNKPAAEYASGRAPDRPGRRLCNPGCELLMHGDIVQIAQAILQVFQNGEKTLAMLFDLFPGNIRFGKTPWAYRQFFGLDPKLVPRAGNRFCPVVASFRIFFQRPVSLLTRLGFQSAARYASRSRCLAARAASGFQPCAAFQCQVTKSLRKKPPSLQRANGGSRRIRQILR